MIDKQTQKYRVIIELEYEEEVFPGDPDDAYQLADLERDEKTQYAQNALHNVFYYDSMNLEIEPILGE